MWSSAIFAVIAALSTGARNYVDRRVGELTSQANRLTAEQRDKAQQEREALLRAQVEDAQRRQREADEKLAQVEGQVRPRRLAPGQRELLVQVAQTECRNVPLINVTAANSNNEAQRYAQDFVVAFRAAGCTANLALPIPGLRPEVTGLHLGVRTPGQTTGPAVSMAQALRAAGIEFSVTTLEPDFFPDVPFVLVIGAKTDGVP